MKIMYYRRHQASGFHVHAFSAADCAYLPRLGVVVGRETSGSFQASKPFCTDNESMLAEARLILEGKAGDVAAAQITKVRHGEIDDELTQRLVTHLRFMSDARTKADDILKSLMPDKE